jgi:hypothetical protein
MRATRTAQALATCATALAVAACGQSSASRHPTLAGLPLTSGTRVVASVNSCDRGANPYCALQLVVVGSRYPSSTALLNSEAKHLRSLGWTKTGGDTGAEMADDSPGHKLRLTYATASDDLRGLDLGWIQRSRPIARALSGVIFDRAPALSLMLETGSS